MGNFFNNRSVFLKTIMPPLMSFCVIAGSLVYAGRGLQKALGNYGNVSNTVAVSAIHTALSGVHATMYKLLSLAAAGTSDDKLQSLGTEQLNTLKKIRTELETLAKSVDVKTEELQLVDAMKTGIGNYNQNIKKVIDMISVDQSLATVLMKPADENYDLAAANLSKLEASRLKALQTGFETSMASIKTTVVQLVVSLVIGGILVFGLSLVVARSVYIPLQNLVRFVEEIAQGNLRQQMQMDRKDEIGVLACALERMRTNIKRMIGQNSEVIQEISGATQSQSSSIEQVSSSIGSVLDRAKESEKNTMEVNSLMEKIDGELAKSRGQLDSFGESIAEIMDASQRANDIVHAIESVAFQTNLLALNAAVEAARAGEAGSGFAVVAEEVRNLAQRASVAANNTSTIINKISTDIKTGDDLLMSTTQSFDGVVASSKHIKELVSSIWQGSKEQNSNISQITSVMKDISNAAGEHLRSAHKLQETANMFKT